MQASPGTRFFRGVVTGIISTLILIAVVYALNMMGLVVIAINSLPNAPEVLNWAFENLRLSIIPFTLIIIFYFRVLYELKKSLSDPQIEPERIAQLESWVNIAISLFFGIGVIWTAIGMRSALIAGLSDLDGAMAAQLGSFEILRRLIKGGILLALSTTIFGAMGGYLMRINKIFLVGAKLQQFYSQRTRSQIRFFEQRLENIESYLAQLVTKNNDGSPNKP